MHARTTAHLRTLMQRFGTTCCSCARRSSSGIVISLVLVLNAIFWNAFTQTTSSCQAELNGFFEAALLVDFYRACLSFLGARCSR